MILSHGSGRGQESFSSAGLSSAEARRRLAEEGFNQIPFAARHGTLAIALGVAREPMFLSVWRFIWLSSHVWKAPDDRPCILAAKAAPFSWSCFWFSALPFTEVTALTTPGRLLSPSDPRLDRPGLRQPILVARLLHIAAIDQPRFLVGRGRRARLFGGCLIRSVAAQRLSLCPSPAHRPGHVRRCRPGHSGIAQSARLKAAPLATEFEPAPRRV